MQRPSRGLLLPLQAPTAPLGQLLKNQRPSEGLVPIGDENGGLARISGAVVEGVHAIRLLLTLLITPHGHGLSNRTHWPFWLR